MKKLPVGLQGIKEIITNDFLYVDKTQQIYELIEKGKLYFLSRPRRFGKSLTISTLVEIFSGNRDLFKGLYIAEQTDYGWESYPILQFSFNVFGHQTTELKAQLGRQLNKYAQLFEVSIQQESLTEQFNSLVENISAKGQPVVILIDEYDKPIVDFIANVDQARVNQKVLKDFFSPLKNLERLGHIRFLFITGVSKFSKVSLFSDLNNLTDLSVAPMAKDLTGITQEELIQYFPDYIEQASQKFRMTREELLKGLKIWYDGYSFDGEVLLYNPFSLLSFFQQNRFRNFWFATGTPTFLVKMIRNQRIDPQKLENKKVTEAFFDKFSLEKLDITGLLFQTGYLTIKKTVPNQYEVDYVLGYPNEEVRKSFMHNLLEAFTFQSNANVSSALLYMRDGLKEGNLNLFFDNLKVLLADLSYHHLPKSKKDPTEKELLENINLWEGYFHTIIYLITTFLGLEVQSEVTMHRGRLDLVAQTTDFLYLMEFKLDATAAEAIQQIKNQKYAAPYLNTSKTLMLVGVNFSKEERTVENWESEIIEK